MLLICNSTSPPMNTDLISIDPTAITPRDAVATKKEPSHNRQTMRAKPKLLGFKHCMPLQQTDV